MMKKLLAFAFSSIVLFGVYLSLDEKETNENVLSRWNALVTQVEAEYGQVVLLETDTEAGVVEFVPMHSVFESEKEKIRVQLASEKLTVLSTEPYVVPVVETAPSIISDTVDGENYRVLLTDDGKVFATSIN